MVLSLMVIAAGCGNSLEKIKTSNSKEFEEKVKLFVLSDDVPLSKDEKDLIIKDITKNVTFELSKFDVSEDKEQVGLKGTITNKSSFNVDIALEPMVLDKKNNNVNGTDINKFGANLSKKVDKGQSKEFSMIVPIKKDSEVSTVVFKVADFEIKN